MRCAEDARRVLTIASMSRRKRTQTPELKGLVGISWFGQALANPRAIAARASRLALPPAWLAPATTPSRCSPGAKWEIVLQIVPQTMGMAFASYTLTPAPGRRVHAVPRQRVRRLGLVVYCGMYHVCPAGQRLLNSPYVTGGGTCHSQGLLKSDTCQLSTAIIVVRVTGQ